MDQSDSNLDETIDTPSSSNESFKIINDNIENILIIEWNCNSLSGKIGILKTFLEELFLQSPNLRLIVVLVELKLCTEDANELLRFNKNIPAIALHKCRTKRGGGVGLIISKSLNYKRLTKFNDFDEELIVIDVLLEKMTVAIAGWYVPPRKHLNNLIFNELESNHPNFLVIGDLNAKHLELGNRKSNQSGKNLIEQINGTTLTILNDNSHTFKIDSRNYSERLDLAIASQSVTNAAYEFKVLKNSILDSNHWPISVKLRIDESPYLIEPTNDESWDYNRIDWVVFIIEYNKTNLSYEVNSDPNDLHAKFSEKLIKCIRAAAPKKKYVAPLALPKNIVKMLKEKKRLYKKFRQRKTQRNFQNYLKAKKASTAAIYKNRDEKWLSFLRSQGRSPTSTRPFFKRLARMSNKPDSTSIPVLVDEQTTYSTDEEKAKAFSKKLSKTFNETTSKRFDENFKSQIDNYIESKEFINEYADKKYYPITVKELDKELKKITSKPSLDSDLISNVILKRLHKEARMDMLNLFNSTLATSTIPKIWKQATLTMIIKKDADNSLIKSYRPISILSVIGKLCEKILIKRFVQYLESKNIMVAHQSGFRKHRNTSDNITVLTQSVKNAFSNGQHLVSIFFDIASAFDKVWHNGLIFKMISQKIPLYLVLWFKELLSDREFRVKVGSFITDFDQISMGCPQGSSASPPLFSYYVNDMPTLGQNKKSYTMKFADDLAAQIRFFANKVQEAENEMNNFLRQLEFWLNIWRMEMAPHKCKYIIFSKKKEKKSNEMKMNFVLYDQVLEKEAFPTFLGVTFDAQLTFKKHGEQILAKMTKRLNLIKLVAFRKWKISKISLRTTYVSLVSSIFEYTAGIIQSFNHKVIEKLQIVQNNAIRIILGKSKLDKIKVETLHSKIKLKTVEKRCETLRQKYFMRAIDFNNPWLLNMWNEFQGEAMCKDSPFGCEEKFINNYKKLTYK
jgi:hypothetical protein